MPHADFVHLRVHSAYSLSEGAIKADKIAAAAQDAKMPAVAITDTGNLFGALEFSQACAARGVQPIIGTLLAVARPGGDVSQKDGAKPPAIDWLALYAQDETGYENLCALVSRAHLDRPIEQPAHVAFADLEGRTEGLIALTSGGEGALARLFAEDQPARASLYADRLQALFGDRLYIEVARRGDAILLSPGCASYDWYSSYAERGDDFARAVRVLIEGSS